MEKKIPNIIKTNGSLIMKAVLIFIFILLLASTVMNAFFRQSWTGSLEVAPPAFKRRFRTTI